MSDVYEAYEEANSVLVAATRAREEAEETLDYAGKAYDRALDAVGDANEKLRSEIRRLASVDFGLAEVVICIGLDTSISILATTNSWVGVCITRPVFETAVRAALAELKRKVEGGRDE